MFLVAFFFITLPGFSQVTLECDYASSENSRKPMYYHWDISNRISPMNGFKIPAGKNPGINVVRPLGGKSSGGKKIINEDTYKWDGEKYYYDWTPLKKQINNVTSKSRLYQLMIDNAPWAFQRGVDLKGGKEVETYGNAWPPNDANAWSLYIKAMLKELIITYGREKVEQWRYCIGREIGTSGHWHGGQLAFFEHYKNTENAIRAILPNAKVGTHFLWASSKTSFGPAFVKWCKQNNAHYDFVAVSYYPFYNQIKRVDMDHVYKVDFAPIKDIPEWNSAATLEIHEFALIKSMSSRGNSFKNAPAAHQESFTVMLAKMMYEKDIFNVFRWGSGANKAAEHAFLVMKGNTYFTSSKRGTPKSPGNMVDAVFARDRSNKQYNIMAYNYNAIIGSENSEPVRIVAAIPVPPGTGIKYRDAFCQKNGLRWSAWKTGKTAAGKNSKESVVSFLTNIPVFSFVKYEIIAE